MNAIAQASSVSGPQLDNRRVLAGVADLAIVALGAVVVLFAGDALSGDRSDVQGALGAVILGWALYYYFALESGDGQTIGKRLMKLRVVRADGRPAGMREIAVRTILRVVDAATVYAALLLTGQRRQRIGDLAAGTIVVDASAPVAVPAPAVEEDLDVDEPVADEDEPVAEADEPAADEAPAPTITLPTRPSPPATLADITSSEAPAEAPAVPEMRPFPPVEEPVVEQPVEEPVVEVDQPVVDEEPVIEVEEWVVADEPVVAVEEPVAEVEEQVVVEEPVAEVEEPVVDDEPVAEEAPVVEVEPAEEELLPEITSPSLEELARDVASAHHEPEAEQETPADEDPDESFTVKTVETVSAIDLVMGGAPEEDSSDDAPEPA